MCKIIKYWFSCDHGFRPRGSRCKGTKHKHLRSGKVAACKSESYLNITIPTDCGPCQHQSFENRWKRKLSLARNFLETIREKNFPGVTEVAVLVEQLEQEFDTASWGSRALFPHLHGEKKERINLGYFEKKPSPLRCEVRPEDVCEPEESMHPDHPDYEFDWDYVASTDPLRPVDTNYAHPTDDMDHNWMPDDLTSEEGEKSGTEGGFDASDMERKWTDNLEEPHAFTLSWGDDGSDWDLNITVTASPPHNTLWAADPEAHAIATTTRNDLTSDNETVRQARVDMIIHEFWTLVNEEDPCDQSREPTSPASIDLTAHFNDIDISNPSSTKPDLLTQPPTPPHPPTDASHNSTSQCLTASASQPLQPPPTHHPFKNVLPTKPSTSRRSLYDKWRSHISNTRDVDKVKFNQDLLLLSRCELRDFEGPDGRRVPDPQVP